jgi:hypothetical protein
MSHSFKGRFVSPYEIDLRNWPMNIFFKLRQWWSEMMHWNEVIFRLIMFSNSTKNSAKWYKNKFYKLTSYRYIHKSFLGNNVRPQKVIYTLQMIRRKELFQIINVDFGETVFSTLSFFYFMTRDLTTKTNTFFSICLLNTM